MTNNARIQFLLNKNATKAVVFRKGPSKWTQLLSWNLDKNEVQSGQWFHGRVYIEKSAFSPDGNYIALALTKHQDKHKGKNYSWLSISKPPFFTAFVTLISTYRQAYGGYFLDNNTFIYQGSQNSIDRKDNFYNHNFTIKYGFDSPKWKLFGENPLHSQRLDKKGWKITTSWKGTYLKTEIAEVRERKLTLSSSLIMERFVDNFDRTTNYYLKTSKGVHKFENVECLDIDFEQRILISKHGKLYRTTNSDYINLRFKWELIADLNENTFEEVLPPENYFQ